MVWIKFSACAKIYALTEKMLGTVLMKHASNGSPGRGHYALLIALTKSIQITEEEVEVK